MEIKLVPDLSHCIETVAKTEYERILTILLRGDREDKELEERLELLRLFLESADFSVLRSCCDEALLAGKAVMVTVTSAQGKPQWRIEVAGEDERYAEGG